MVFCSDCFCDLEIKSRIESHSKRGFCCICKKESMSVYDTSIDEYLNGIFDKIINLYTVLDSRSISVEEPIFLKEELVEKWKIFNN